jgi:hypothetical protein
VSVARKADPRRVPHVCPRDIMTMIRMQMHRERPAKVPSRAPWRNVRNEKFRGSSPPSSTTWKEER